MINLSSIFSLYYLHGLPGTPSIFDRSFPSECQVIIKISLVCVEFEYVGELPENINLYAYIGQTNHESITKCQNYKFSLMGCIYLGNRPCSQQLYAYCTDQDHKVSDEEFIPYRTMLSPNRPTFKSKYRYFILESEDHIDVFRILLNARDEIT